eukprot:GFUD01040500.1.p1 GENE.GFUD01040500.1~~GFUD01040500.1.p1  ORF type:complete len:1081 (+),score=293.90 GFUD01040500.1:82-3243(+)
MDHDFEINFPEDKGDADKYFAFTGFSGQEERELVRKVEQMGGFVLSDATWNESCTHVISRTFEKSEVVLAGLAGGRWILKKEFVLDSFQNKSWSRARRYVHDEIVISHRKNWKRLGRAGGAFYNMKALFVMDDTETKEVYQRIVEAGGGMWVGGDLRRARQDRFDGDHLTHIIIDPWVMEQNDWRYRDFEEWKRYERRVSMNSSADGEGPGWRNAGMLFKLHYTYLMDKLLHPLEKIIEIKYTIFDEKVQKMAKLRKRRRAEMKVKLERKFKKVSARKRDDSSSDEDDLVVIKERYKEKERSKQPGRFYIEKQRPSMKESLCEREVKRQEQSRQGWRESRKREKSPDELVANLGYMESSRKKNKRSGGSQIQADPGRHFKVGPDGRSVYVDTDLLIKDHGFGPLESRQSSYISNLAQSIKDIEKSHSRQFGQGSQSQSFKEEKWAGFVKTEYDSKFGIKQENRFKSQNRRPFKTEVVVELDSDSDIEEVSREISNTVKTENKALVTIDDDDDDIVILSSQKDSLPPGIVVISDPIEHKTDVRKVDPDGESNGDVKDVKLMEVDRDWKVESDDDEIEIIDVDRKPAIDKLLKFLGSLPEITIDSSDSDCDEAFDDSEDDIVIVPPCRVVNTAETKAGIAAMDVPSADIEDSGIESSNSNMEISLDLEPLISTTEAVVDIVRQSPEKPVPNHCRNSQELPIYDGFLSNDHELPLLKKVSERLATEHTLFEENNQFSVKVPSTFQSAKPVDILPEPSQLEPSPHLLLQQLNLTLLARQDVTAEHISISQVCGRTPQYNKHNTQEKEKTASALVPVVCQALMEFTRLREDVEIGLVRRRRSGRKTQKRIVDEIEAVDPLAECDLVKILKILDGHVSSKNYPHPEILNCIFSKFFLSQKSPHVIKQAQDFLSKFFFIHFGEKGANRKLLMDILLNSLREVSDRSLFKTFDKNNSLDTRSVWTFFKVLLDSSLKFEEKEVNGCEELLKVLVKIFQTDIETWWKHERKSDRAVSFPLIYYAFGGSDFQSNCENVVPAMVGRCITISQTIATPGTSGGWWP